MKRDTSIDIAKGIAIVLMVVGHCDQLIPHWLFRTIFSFHLPLFFFFSGFFFSTKRTIWEECKHSAKALLVPYLITGVVVIGLNYLLYSPEKALHSLSGLLMASMGRRDLKMIFPYSAGPIWFLCALFWCRVLFRIIYEINGKWSAFVALIIGVGFMVLGKSVINLPLAFGNGASALVFYAGGYIYRIIASRYFQIIQHYKWWLCGICSIIWCIAINYSYLNIDQYLYLKFPLPIFGAFAGIYVVWMVSNWLSAHGECIIAYLGTYTLEILCCHTIAFSLCSWIIRTLQITVHFKFVAAGLTIILSAIIIGCKEIVKWKKS